MAFIFTLILFAVFFVLNEFLKPKNDQEQGRAGLGDFRFPTATEGRPVPIIWGTVKLAGPNVIWYGDLSQIPITTEVKTGIFSSDTVTTGFAYRVGMQFALCRGDVEEIRRIWIGDEEVFSGSLVGGGSIVLDDKNFFGGNELGNGGIQGTLRMFSGDEVQTAPTYLTGFQSEGGETPGYRGTCFVLAEAFYVGNSTSIKPWAFEARRIPNGLGLSTGSAELNDFNDANPMNVLYEILTNDEWGLNFPPGDIDTTNFSEAALVLAGEGNGFSFVLDRTIELTALVREIERQVDGIVFLNRSTGKWQIKLARADYDIKSLPFIDESNIVAINEFSRGAWEDTVNHVKIGFADRGRDYFETFALAQDMANVFIQAGQNNPTVINYPGVKDQSLANSIAWRDLRTLSYPLAKAKITVDRSFWNTNPADVFAWSDEKLGIVRLPMRVTKIGLGDMDSGKITLDLVQDVFEFSAGVFADPPPTGWSPPVDSLVPFPDEEQIAIEAPYAFIARDPVFPGQRSRVWAAGRKQDNATLFDIATRFDPVNPTGGYTITGTVVAFMFMAELDAAISKSLSDIPEATLVVETSNFDSKELIEAAISTVSAQDIGLSLANIIMIGDPGTDSVEFAAFSGLTVLDPGPTRVSVSGVYRGLLDTTPQDWPAGTNVYFLYLGGGLTNSSFPVTDDVDVVLLPRSVTDQVSVGSAVVEELQFARRDLKPYPPSRLTLENIFYDDVADLDNGSTLDGRGLTVGYRRRDWRSPDEVVALTVDASAIQGDFPAFNSNEYRLRVTNDPSGSPTLLYVTDWVDSDSIELERETVLRGTDGVLPTELGLEIETRHDILNPAQSDVLANYRLGHDFTVQFSDIGGHFNTGAGDFNETSTTFVVPDSGDYVFTIGSDVITGGASFQTQVNGGGFSSLFSAGQTTGTLVGLTANDTVEWRHTQSSGFDETFLEILNVATPADSAYGILIGE